MMNLITDRTQSHVDYLKQLNAKGWIKMNPTEKAEWSGNPLLSQYMLNHSSPVNLFSGSYYSGTGAWVKTDGEVFTVTPPQPNLSQTVMRFSLGEADYLIGQTVTFSFASATLEGDITPVLSFCWSDSNTNIAQLDITRSNSITFDCPVIVSSGVKLYAFLYFTSGAAIAPDDAVVTLNRIMFEFGSVAHDYVPYQPVLDTYARRGAYNYTDLNRVEAAVSEIADLMGLTLTTKTDWGVWDIPTVTEMARYLGNVTIIKDAILASDSTIEFPVLPDNMGKLSWKTANNIEEALNTAWRNAPREPETYTPTNAGYYRTDSSFLETTSGLHTDFVPLAGRKRVRYKSYLWQHSSLASWAIFDESKTCLFCSDDVSSTSYYHYSTDGSTIPYGYLEGTINVTDLRTEYPTAAYIVVSTWVQSNSEYLYDKDGVNVGWSSDTPYLIVSS